jgi:fibronectin type 3 domain-containing protein/mono/diheme cytochrome c family protein
MTPAAVAGREVFRSANCAQCHGGASFTNSAAANLQNIGTIKPTSGTRLGGTLNGIDVPTLRDVWATAPYLHDGSAATLAAAILAHNGVTLSGSDVANLVAYVEQIGGQDSSAPTPNRSPTITNPGNQSGKTGTAVNLAISASDPDGDALIYSATGLPAGLTINSSTGVITGTPTAVGTSNVVVSARDALVTVSASFTWGIVVGDTTAPSTPGSFTASVSTGRPVLSWGASTDNVGLAGYIVYRSTNGTQGAEVARTTARTWTDTAFTENVQYTYSVKAYDAAGNLSGLSALRSVRPNQAPSTPSNLTASLSNGDPRLAWTASTDNVKVTGYIIYRSTSSWSTGSEIARTSSTNYTDTSARAGTRYTYNVRAYDAVGNNSGRSSLVTIRAQ